MLPVFVFVFLPVPSFHYQISFKATLAVILWYLNFVPLVICFIKCRGNDTTYLEYDMCVCVGGGGGEKNRVKSAFLKGKVFLGKKKFLSTIFSIKT